MPFRRADRIVRPARRLLRLVALALLAFTLFGFVTGVTNSSSTPTERLVFVAVGVGLVILALPLFRS